MNKQIKFGIILQYFQMALSILISLIYTPIMLRLLGQSEYGIYNLASSIISYLSLLSLGFGASYLRYYSRYKKDDNHEEIAKLNGLYILVFSVIGVIALISGIILSNNVELFFNSTYSSDDKNIARVLMIFLSINLAISFPASVFVSYVTSQEKFIFQKLINMGKTICSPCLSIVALLLGFGSIGMVIIVTVVNLLVDIINIYYCFFKLNMKIKFSKPNGTSIKEIAIFSSFIAINQVVDQLNWQTDKVILGKMVTSSSVAIYSVGAQINNMFISFSTAISSVFTPKINLIVSKNEENMDNQLTDIFLKVGRLQFIVLMLILSGFVFFGKYFIYKWAGSGYDNAYYVAVLLIGVSIISLSQNIGVEIQRAKNKHHIRSIIYLIIAVINVVISVLLAPKYGEVGCALGTAISVILGPVIFMNIYYHFKLNIDMISFWKSILSLSKSFILPIIIGVIIMNFCNYTSIFDYIGCIIIYIIVYLVSVYFFGTTIEEKKWIRMQSNKFKMNKKGVKYNGN